MAQQQNNPTAAPAPTTKFNNVTTSAYDGYDRLAKMTMPDSTYELYGYDANGNPTAKTNRDGKVLSFTPDALNREITRSIPANIVTQAVMRRQLRERFAELPTDTSGTPLIDSIIVKGQQVPFDTSGWHEWQNTDADDDHRFFVETIDKEAISTAEIFLKKRWSVTVSRTGSYITSDRCVTAHHPEREVFGLGTPGTIILFPLSPTRLLVINDFVDEPADQYYVDRAGAAESNYLIWRGSQSFMISPRHPDGVLTEIDLLRNLIGPKGVSP